MRSILCLSLFFSLNSVWAQKVICRNISFFQEACPTRKTSFSFCSDGYEQLFRYHNFMVERKSYSMMKCYKYGVYVLANGLNEYWLIENNIPHDDVDLLEQKMDSISNCTRTFSKVYPNLRKRVLKFYKENDIKMDYDGRLLYKKMKLRVSYVFWEKKKIYVPKVNKKTDDSTHINLEEKIVDMYIITKIW